MAHYYIRTSIIGGLDMPHPYGDKKSEIVKLFEEVCTAITENRYIWFTPIENIVDGAVVVLELVKRTHAGNKIVLQRFTYVETGVCNQRNGGHSRKQQMIDRAYARNNSQGEESEPDVV